MEYGIRTMRGYLLTPGFKRLRLILGQSADMRQRLIINVDRHRLSERAITQLNLHFILLLSDQNLTSFYLVGFLLNKSSIQH